MQAIVDKIKGLIGLKKTKKSITQPLNRTSTPLPSPLLNNNLISTSISVKNNSFGETGKANANANANTNTNNASNGNGNNQKSSINANNASNGNSNANSYSKHNSYNNYSYKLTTVIEEDLQTEDDLPVFDPDDLSDEIFSNDNSSISNNNSNNTNSNSTNKNSSTTLRLSETHLFQSLAKVLSISDDVLRLVSSEFCAQWQVLPIELIGNTLRIAYINSIHKGTAEKLLRSQHPNLQFEFMASTEKFLLHHIHESYSGLNSRVARENEEQVRREQALRIAELETSSNTATELIFSHNTHLDAEQNRMLSLVSKLLCQMKRADGTDLNIDYVTKTGTNGVKEGFLQVRMRVERDLVLLYDQPISLDVYSQLPRMLKVICGRESTDERSMSTGKVKAQLVYGTKKTLVQLRVNFLPTGQDRGISISIRLQDRENFKHSLANIALTKRQQEIIRNEVLRLTSGLVLVVGPVNHGKNTSCISFLKELSELYPKRKFVTVEDPIEYDLSFATQAEVEEVDGKDARSYADYISTVLRHDLNTLYIGEIRDDESAHMAVKGANLGHLVISTIHTNSACEVVARLRSLRVSPYDISNVLRTIISQRLVKKVCSECVRVNDDTAKQIPRLNEYIDKLAWNDEPNFTRGSGKDNSGNICRNCQGSGYRGVTAIFEILKLSRTLRKFIVDGVTSDELKFQAQKNGFISLWYAGLEKALLGETTLEQVLDVLSGLPDEEVEGLPHLDSLENKSFYDSFEDVLAN